MIKRTLAILLFLSTAAHGAEWEKLGHIRSSDEFFFDRSKLVAQGDEITYWKKVVFKQAQPVAGKSAAWVLMRERIHCSQHTLRLISYLYYSADGAIIEYVADHEKEGSPIIPDSIGDAFERHMCEIRSKQVAIADAAKDAAKPAPAPVAAPNTAPAETKPANGATPP